MDPTIPWQLRPRPHVALPHRREFDQSWMIETGMELIGRWIHDARNRAGFTQAQLARMSGLHQSTISRLERGKLQGLSLHRLAVLVTVLEHVLADLPFRGARRQ
jgi:ribosome-binding protein aMBF1 (putative translation factor)